MQAETVSYVAMVNTQINLALLPVRTALSVLKAALMMLKGAVLLLVRMVARLALLGAGQVTPISYQTINAQIVVKESTDPEVHKPPKHLLVKSVAKGASTCRQGYSRLISAHNVQQANMGMKLV